MKKNQTDKSRNIQPAKVQRRYAPVISAIVAALCILIYLTAVVQATVRIYLSIEKSKTIADREFYSLAETANENGMHGFMDEEYKKIIQEALSKTLRLEALIISGPDGEFAFEKKKDYAVAWVDNSPRFIRKFNLSNQNYYRPLGLRDSRGASIRAVANAFEYDEFINILKQTLFFIMIGFAISFLTMLLQLLLRKQEHAHVNDQDSSEYYSGERSSQEFYSEEQSSREYSFGKYDSTENTSTDNILQKDKNTNYQTSSANAYTSAEFQTVDTSGPKGLYSTRTGIGWEDYLKDRLDSELHRCSSTEKDLVLVLIEFTDLSNDDMYKQSAEEAITAYTSRDLLFEYGKWGLSLILPGISLETAIRKSEKYYQYIMKKFPRGYNKTTGVYIGITSRSGRLLNSDRLKLEASEALRKAKSDPKAPIIAFKSDPEKYREFILNKK